MRGFEEQMAFDAFGHHRATVLSALGLFGYQQPGSAAQQDASQYTVGQRVQVSVGGIKPAPRWQPCTVTSPLAYGAVGVRCDPYNGLPFTDYSAMPDWIRPWPNAVAAPSFECSFDTPPGKVTRTALPSPELFKRVIYENYLSTEKARMGMGRPPTKENIEQATARRTQSRISELSDLPGVRTAALERAL